MLKIKYSCDNCRKDYSNIKDSSEKVQIFDVCIGIRDHSQQQWNYTSCITKEIRMWCKDCLTKHSMGKFITVPIDEKILPTPTFAEQLTDLIGDMISDEVTDQMENQ